LKNKGSVTISSIASDDSGTSGLTQALYIDNTLVASVSGGTLSYSWNVNKVLPGTHTITVKATDAARNSSSTSISVTK
jgi:hypothetical protein